MHCLGSQLARTPTSLQCASGGGWPPATAAPAACDARPSLHTRPTRVRTRSHVPRLRRFIFLQYPYVARALAPLVPLNGLYHIIPFMPFVIFLAVYSGVANNPNLSRYIRYNALQAVLLDILLMWAARRGARRGCLLAGMADGAVVQVVMPAGERTQTRAL